MSSAYAWTVFATLTAATFAVIAILANALQSLGARINDTGARIDTATAALGARIDSATTSLGARIDTATAALGARIDHLGAEMRAQTSHLAGELRSEIDALRTENRQGFAQVDNRLRLLERDRSG